MVKKKFIEIKYMKLSLLPRSLNVYCFVDNFLKKLLLCFSWEKSLFNSDSKLITNITGML